ncbi:MAG: hypothetical protein HC772_13425 [Leptolyngbyaceae cyanobacterium CRU_2_3]|nr:hypothetical protein [Leptolyngbyaceae cyanobacterium CRU_2_3]
MMQKSLITLLATTGLVLTPGALSSPGFAQRISNFEPPSSSTNVSPSTSISGQFDTTTGVEVDLSTVKIFVNGRDVTSQSTITRSLFTYRPSQPFPAGQVQVRVEFKNTNGNARSTSWAFTVQQSQPAGQISSISHDGVSTVLTTGQTLTLTMRGTAGLQGTFLLILDNRTVREIPARETASGTYTASLTVQQSDRISEGIILGRLRRPASSSGQSPGVYAAASQPVVFNSASGGSTGGGSTGGGSPTPGNTTLQPRFTSHQDGGDVGTEGFTLVGQTRPNAKVQIKVVAGASILGITVGGQTVVDTELTADNTGRFQVAVPSPPVNVPGLRYRVQATAREGNQTSPQTQINLRSR